MIRDYGAALQPHRLRISAPMCPATATIQRKLLKWLKGLPRMTKIELYFIIIQTHSSENVKSLTELQCAIILVQAIRPLPLTVHRKYEGAQGSTDTLPNLQKHGPLLHHLFLTAARAVAWKRWTESCHLPILWTARRLKATVSKETAPET